MKDKIRLFLWRLLGIQYFHFLNGQKKVYLSPSANIEIGYKTYHNGAFVWQWHKKARLWIGSYCSIANDVHFILDSGFHQTSEVSTFPHFNHMNDKSQKIGTKSITEFVADCPIEKCETIIGNDVWIGMNAIILPGVVIGNGVTILAGAVVSNNIPDYAIAGGVPAKVLKMKYEDQVIDSMKKIAWWNWSHEKVEKNIADFYIPVEEFVKKWMPETETDN